MVEARVQLKYFNYDIQKLFDFGNMTLILQKFTQINLVYLNMNIYEESCKTL